MKLVFVYGGAASGKLTGARELANLTGLVGFVNLLRAVPDRLLLPDLLPQGEEETADTRRDIYECGRRQGEREVSASDPHATPFALNQASMRFQPSVAASAL